MFFDDNLLLYNQAGKALYEKVKSLPIIDYHCHLDQKKIARDDVFGDIGELWLAGDHYKWRAMRMNGVEEHYITGSASNHDKFIKYAEMLPNLIGNPLYYWTHRELKMVCGLTTQLNADTAESIYAAANEKLKSMSVRSMLHSFGVRFIATTDDPTDDLCDHKTYGDLRLTPTFRPDKLFDFSEEYLLKLGQAANITINTLDDLQQALTLRLDFFVSKGCRMADHGLDAFPATYADRALAQQLFENRNQLPPAQKDLLKGYLLVFLAKEYAQRHITMQLHIAVTRNVNPAAYALCGPDSGFDVISETPAVHNVLNFFQQLGDNERPSTLLYTLNDANLAALALFAFKFLNIFLPSL